MSAYDTNAPLIYSKLKGKEQREYLASVLATMEPDILVKALQTMPMGDAQRFLQAYTLYHSDKYRSENYKTSIDPLDP